MRRSLSLCLAAVLAIGCSGGSAPGPSAPVAQPAVSESPTPPSSQPPSASPSPTAPAETRGPTPSPAPTGSGLPRVSFVRADLAAGAQQGVSLDAGAHGLDAGGLHAGTYTETFAPRATITHEYGTWTSARSTAPFAFEELIASWSAATPAGSWIEVEAQARGTGRETKWYRLALWGASDG